jgi:uncharacterized protein with beta-barrel porin domain
MPQKNRRFLKIYLLFFFANEAQAVTLTSGQTDYVTTADITIGSVGISSTLSGTSLSLNKITNLHTITTGNFGAVSSGYGIKSSGNYNQISNAFGAAIFTTGSSGRGISVTNNSIVTNEGSINTQGTTSYGIYAGGNNNSLSNSGSITTANTTSYGIYLSGNNNSATNSGSIATKVYGIYVNGDANQVANYGAINTAVSSSAHGIYVSAGSSSGASPINYTSVNNFGAINASGHGIYVKDNYSSINNSGTISNSGSSIYGVRIDGNNSVFTNSGTINSANYAIYNSGTDNVFNNSGNINGGINIGAGTLNIFGGSVSGSIDGDSGSGFVNVNSTTFNQSADFNDLDIVTIANGGALNSNAKIFANEIVIDANSTLTLNAQSSTAAQIKGLSNASGTLNISQTSFASTKSIGIFGNSLAQLNINRNASLLTANNIYASNIFLDGFLNISSANNLIIFGNLAGSGLGALNIGAQNQTIDGNFSLNSGDQLIVALKNNGVGSLAVSGVANIDANTKLQINTNENQGYIVSGTQYNLVSGASGSTINAISNSNISANGANSNVSGLLKFSTASSANNLILKIERLSASSVTQNKNSQNIYQSLTDVGAGSSGKLLQFQQHLDAQNFNNDEITKTLNQLAPQSSKAALAAVNGIVNNSISVSENRLENRDHILKESFWAQGFGGSISQKQIADDDAYKINSAGIAFGLDKKISKETTIGASFSLAKASAKYLDSSKQNLIDIYQVNFYGGKNFGKYFIDSVGALALSQFDSSRTINATNANAFAKYYGQTYALKIKSGFVNRFKNGFNITPEASLNFLHNNISGYNEQGADELNLKVGAVSANFLEARAGLNFGYVTKILELPEFRKFAAALKFSYGHAFINDAPSTIASFSGQQSNFASQISHIDSSSLKIGAEFFAYHKDNTIFSIDYNVERRATSNSFFVLAKIRDEF